jgi:hypothetical protein
MIEHENNPQSSDRANNNPKSDVGKFREKIYTANFPQNPKSKIPNTCFNRCVPRQRSVLKM